MNSKNNACILIKKKKISISLENYLKKTNSFSRKPCHKVFEGLKSYENRFYCEKSAKKKTINQFFVQNLAKQFVDPKFLAVLK